MKVLKALGYIYIPFALITLVLVGWLIYYYMFLVDNVVVVANFVDSASYAEDETFFIEMNYFGNEKNNGEQVFEIKLNYYIEPDVPVKDEEGNYSEKYIYSSGAQFNADDFVLESETLLGWWQNTDQYRLKNVYYYDKDAGNNGFKSTEELSKQDQWIWDVDGQLCLLQMKGKTFNYTGTLGWNCYFNYDASALIFTMYNLAKSMPDGQSVKMINLSQYFHLLEQDSDGKFTNEITDDNVLEEKTYVNIKINKSNNGMISAEQSLFKSYYGDSDWTFDGSEESQTYWVDETIYNIGLQDFRYSLVKNSTYELVLKNSCVDFLDDFEYLVLNVDIDLDDINFNLNVIGFAENAFADLRVNQITLTASSNKEFVVYSPELYNIVTNNVTVVEGGGA